MYKYYCYIWNKLFNWKQCKVIVDDNEDCNCKECTEYMIVTYM
jgi:hypothetical protein